MAKKSTSTKKKLNKLNETGKRKGEERRDNEEPVAKERRKGHRRRQIDPTTCERDYSEREIEFMQALDEYKRLSGRMFPTCSEILEVIYKLGYRQVADLQDIYNPDSENESSANDEESLKKESLEESFA